MIVLEIADIDECAEGSFTCNENAACSNNDGGYDCICNAGYEGDGQKCNGKYGIMIAFYSKSFFYLTF